MLSYFVFAASYVSSFVADRLRRDDRGVTAVEYGLILALIAGVIVVALILLGGDLSSLFNKSATCVSGPSAANCPAGS